SNFNWTPSIGAFPISGPGLQEYGPVTLHGTGFTGGAQVGCNYQSGGFAWGVQIPAHCGQSFRRIADSVPVIADSCR
ncbi:MAG TPA: hypothetical protein VEH77_06020, partial [Roseiarcus sp.]|nr:hypothetical protein [Roseiarcus sp.]